MSISCENCMANEENMDLIEFSDKYELYSCNECEEDTIITYD